MSHLWFHFQEPWALVIQIILHPSSPWALAKQTPRRCLCWGRERVEAILAQAANHVSWDCLEFGAGAGN